MRRRRLRFSVLLTTVVVMVVGFVTLLGILVGNDLGLLTLAVTAFPIRTLANFFLSLAVVTLALTLLIGIANLLFVHATRFVRGQGVSQRLTSAVLLISFLGGIMAYFVDQQLGTDYSTILLEDVQVAIESSLAALLFFALVYGAFRMLRQRISLYRVLFVLTVLVVLIAALPFSELNVIREFTAWLMRVPVSAGARGILLGIALATVVTGIRVLIGQDRSYGE